ncbi:GGDEF domain-containing protein [Vibrio brasiliensis]|uniref:GGDEF domain-containing protein n=1 Tax=Vibrio brasiliensis TaxID=170652 RepID=UPI001EFC6C58|nr:GGDEF domain-containing protein [Vibrio brasiliensis]MCG9727627.1 GGDEF domain-containing protein [Vibrio brasiliensis]
MNFYPNDKLVLFSLGSTLSVSFWLLDSLIDFVIFEQGNSFSYSVLQPSKVELWMRSLVIFLIAIILISNKDKILYLMYGNSVVLDTSSNETLDLNRKLDEQLALNIRLREQAMTDPLTSLLNRRGFHNLFDNQQTNVTSHQGACFIICDIDNFKTINDNYGHDIGDETLIRLSKILKSNIDQPNFVVRWGGEEFIIVLFSHSIHQASVIANHLKNSISSTYFNQAGSVSASFGISQLKPNEAKEYAISRADKALYIAKKNGKNRVEIMLFN